MDEAAHKIEAQIDRTRERLGSNLRELEDQDRRRYRLARAVPRATSLVPRRGDCRRCAPGGGPPPDGSAASVRLFHRRPSQVRLAQRGRQPGAGARTVEQHQRCADRSGRHADHCIHLGVGAGIRRTLSARGTETCRARAHDDTGASVQRHDEGDSTWLKQARSTTRSSTNCVTRSTLNGNFSAVSLTRPGHFADLTTVYRRGVDCSTFAAVVFDVPVVAGESMFPWDAPLLPPDRRRDSRAFHD